MFSLFRQGALKKKGNDQPINFTPERFNLHPIGVGHPAFQNVVFITSCDIRGCVPVRHRGIVSPGIRFEVFLCQEAPDDALTGWTYLVPGDDSDYCK